MFDIMFDWEGLEEAENMIDEVINIYEFEIDDWEKLGNFLVNYIKSEIQNEGHVVTGELLASVQILEIGDNYVIIGSDVLQARILEYGRPAIVKTDGVLAWQDPHTGETVFSHRSGPVAATHIFERSIINGLERYKEQLGKT